MVSPAATGSPLPFDRVLTTRSVGGSASGTVILGELPKLPSTVGSSPAAADVTADETEWLALGEGEVDVLIEADGEGLASAAGSLLLLHAPSTRAAAAPSAAIRTTVLTPLSEGQVGTELL